MPKKKHVPVLVHLTIKKSHEYDRVRNKTKLSVTTKKMCILYILNYYHLENSVNKRTQKLLTKAFNKSFRQKLFTKVHNKKFIFCTFSCDIQISQKYFPECQKFLEISDISKIFLKILSSKLNSE